VEELWRRGEVKDTLVGGRLPKPADDTSCGLSHGVRAVLLEVPDRFKAELDAIAFCRNCLGNASRVRARRPRNPHLSKAPTLV
jgi:hypothetical protein